MFIYRLFEAGWTPGTRPSVQALGDIFLQVGWVREVTSVFGPTSDGLYLIRNGHHRCVALITLVNDGILPREILDTLPFQRFIEPTVVEEVRKTSRKLRLGKMYPFSWVDVLKFNSRQAEETQHLGLTTNLADLEASCQKDIDSMRPGA